METIEDIIERRKNIDNNLFYVDLIPISNKYGYQVVRRKKWHGVRKEGNLIIVPIYDGAELYPNDLALLKIDDTYACFDIKLGKFILGFEYEYKRIAYENGFLKLYKSSEKYGLFELARNKILSKCDEYNEYNLKDNSTEFLWAKRGVFYDYIERETGSLFRLPAVTMAYDTPTGMFGKDDRDVVTLYNKNGLADCLRLREIARQEGGYIALNNYTFHVQHIIDINGNILNI